MAEGWKCPVCGRGVAPTEKVCEHGGAVFAPILPSWPPRIEPRMPSFTGDPYRPPYEITCGGIESTSTTVHVNDSAYQGAGPTDYSFPRSLIFLCSLGQNAGNA